jgi:hypothetical protein
MDDAINSILFHDKASNTLHPRVCIVCDEFIPPHDKGRMGLKTFLKHAPYLRGHASLPPALQQCYTFTIPNDSNANAILKGCLLSPRSKLIVERTMSVMCCSDCKNGLTASKEKTGVLPNFAIANGLAVGTPPECLESLNDIELALVSQARLKGHLFTYWGGCHKSIKGWHCFYEVNPSHTTTVLQAVSEFTQADNIAVVLSGPFTSRQREKVMNKVQVDIRKVLEAFQWLKANNRLYANVTAPVFLREPVVEVLDRSTLVESPQDSDIETREEVRVVFPDGTIDTGGCPNGDAFDRAIAEIRSKCAGTIPFLTTKPSTKVLHDYENENLMRAFPKHFPYGYGYHCDFNIRSAQNGYLRHLLGLSIPAFHEPAFVLVIHNIFERSRALSGALWQVMGGMKSVM